MEAMFDREDRELEQMFGSGILDEGTGNTMESGEQQGLAEIYEDLPDNAVGNIGRAVILLVTIYVLYEVVTILLQTL